MATPHHGTTWTSLLYAGAVPLQTVAWFSVLYCLYYVVPIYKFVLRDLNVVNASGSFPTLVAASDFVVIYSHSDALFPWLLIVFLISMVGLNVIVMKRMNKQSAHVVWLGPQHRLECGGVFVFRIQPARVILIRQNDGHPARPRATARPAPHAGGCSTPMPSRIATSIRH
jgi:hypothetical protein